MKNKLLLCCALLLGAGAVQAQEITKQEKGYFNLTEFGVFTGKNKITASSGGVEISLTQNSNTFSLRNINGWFVTNQISIGAGVGLDGYHYKGGGYNNTLLVFADARYYLKDAKNTFFVYGDLGSSLAVSDNFESGLMYNAGAGYKFKVAKRTAMNASLGYIRQNINTSDDVVTNNISSLAIKVGLLF